MSGYSWNQANPVENFYELKRNINANKERLKEINIKSMLIFADLATHPVIAPLVKTNLKLLIKYFKLQIDFNHLLENKIGHYFPIMSQYYKAVISINEYYMNYFTELAETINKQDRDILIEWINNKSGTDMLIFFEILHKLIVDMTVNYLDYLKEVVQGKAKVQMPLDLEWTLRSNLEGFKNIYDSNKNISKEAIQNTKDVLSSINTDLKEKINTITDNIKSLK